MERVSLSLSKQSLSQRIIQCDISVTKQTAPGRGECMLRSAPKPGCEWRTELFCKGLAGCHKALQWMIRRWAAIWSKHVCGAPAWVCIGVTCGAPAWVCISYLGGLLTHRGRRLWPGGTGWDPRTPVAPHDPGISTVCFPLIPFLPLPHPSLHCPGKPTHSAIKHPQELICLMSASDIRKPSLTCIKPLRSL